jgi:filamentous hemagglutinin family protein
MTMKLSKMFLAGILALALVFGMTLVGCDNGGGGGGGGGGGDSLTGSWVDNRNTPGIVFIFTDVADAAITGAKVAYWSTALNDEGTAASATGDTVTINGQPYSYKLTDNNTTMTVDNYGGQTSAIFNRAKGTSGSTMHGIWSHSGSSTLLIIRTGTGMTFTSVGAGNGGEIAYTLQADANATSIKWRNSNYNTYTKTTDPTQLTIPDPNGQQQTPLITQPSW